MILRLFQQRLILLTLPYAASSMSVYFVRKFFSGMTWTSPQRCYRSPIIPFSLFTVIYELEMKAMTGRDNTFSSGVHVLRLTIEVGGTHNRGGIIRWLGYSAPHHVLEERITTLFTLVWGHVRRISALTGSGISISRYRIQETPHHSPPLYSTALIYRPCSPKRHPFPSKSKQRKSPTNSLTNITSGQDRPCSTLVMSILAV